jgi:hypothetical protein
MHVFNTHIWRHQPEPLLWRLALVEVDGAQDASGEKVNVEPRSPDDGGGPREVAAAAVAVGEVVRDVWMVGRSLSGQFAGSTATHPSQTNTADTAAAT